jgi:carboxy-terminal domain RNA polymerase II polypeptide A small phosphatase
MASTSTEYTGAEDSPVRVSNTSINFEGQVPSIPSPQMSSSPTLGTEAAVSGTPTSEGTQADYPKDKEKSSRSLSTTVKTRTSRRRANKSSTSENAPSSSTHVEKPAAISRSSSKTKVKVYYSTRSAKPSFFAKLARKLVPCTGTSRTHPLDVDDKGSGISDLGSSDVLKEKQGLKDVDKESGPSHLSKATIDSSPAPSPADTSSSLPLAPSNPVTIISLSPAADSDIIIPLSKQLLPESETEGVTSGAVQPPGSTGDDILHDHSIRTHVSGNETDDTGATGDEEYEDANNMEDIEDEEDRLIRQGGAGIPIGPVSGVLLYWCSDIKFSAGRMANSGLFCPQSRHIMLGENVSCWI